MVFTTQPVDRSALEKAHYPVTRNKTPTAVVLDRHRLVKIPNFKNVFRTRARNANPMPTARVATAKKFKINRPAA